MARAKNGILGMVSGKVAHVEFYVMNGKGYVRSAKTKKSKKDKKYRSEDQRAQLKKMTVLSPFLKMGTEFFRVSFRYKTRLTEVFNTAATARGINLIDGIKGEKPDWEINWGGISVAAGPLSLPENVTVSSTEIGFNFAWELGKPALSEDYDHRAMILAYDVDLEVGPACMYELSGAKRKELKDTIKIPASRRGHTHHLFIAFKDTLSDEVSNSVYCGAHVF